jgi:hypothetical protein
MVSLVVSPDTSLENYAACGGFLWSYWTKGAPKGEGGGCQAVAPQTTQNWKLKNTDFVYIMVSEVLRDFPFSRNQPLKSADD